jgi:hypothetical protein
VHGVQEMILVYSVSSYPMIKMSYGGRTWIR